MPSKSKKQQRLMGAAYAYATGQNKDVPDYIKDVAKSFMKKGKKKGTKSLRDFAKTKHKYNQYSYPYYFLIPLSF